MTLNSFIGDRCCVLRGRRGELLMVFSRWNVKSDRPL